MASQVTQHAYNWLKQISPTVMQWDQVPLFGASPAFPWEELGTKLAQLFQLQAVRIFHKETDWRNPEEFTAGFGGDAILLQIGVSNLEGTLIWVMSKSDLSLFMEALLGRKPEDFIPLDSDFYNGFYHYLASHTLSTLTQLPFGKNLGLGLLKSPTLPAEPSLCFELEIGIKTNEDEKQAKGRVIISPQALSSWKQRWVDRTLETSLQSPLAEKLEVPIHLEIGRTKLSQSEWSSVSPGDFIMLDQCSYDLETEKGRVMMTVNGVPMFRAKIKAGNIKILEFPLYYEAASMNNEDSSHDDDLGEFEEGDESLGDEETLGDTEETLPEEHEEQTEGAELEAEETSAATAPPAPKAAEAAKEKKLGPADIPLNIVIEVGRIQMSMQKLLELEPGNTLELDIHPENGVDLVVNGRRIGKAELLRIGEHLGVRILDIG